MSVLNVLAKACGSGSRFVSPIDTWRETSRVPFICISIKIYQMLISSANEINLLAVFADWWLSFSTFKKKVDIEGPVALHDWFGDWGYVCRCISWYVGRCRGSVFLVRRLGDVVKVNILLIDWSRLDNRSRSDRSRSCFGLKTGSHDWDEYWRCSIPSYIQFKSLN